MWSLKVKSFHTPHTPHTPYTPYTPYTPDTPYTLHSRHSLHSLHSFYTHALGPEDMWSNKAPFQPLVKDGRLYGRGSGDMKAGVVAYCIAFRGTCFISLENQIIRISIILKMEV